MKSANPHAPLYLLAHVAEGNVFEGEEMAHALALDCELNRLVKQVEEHGNRSARDFIQGLVKMHRDNPTEENFAALKKAQLDREVLEANNRKLRAEARFARDEFIDKTYRPFFAGILFRLFKAAEEWLKMRSENEASIADSLGLEPPGDSGVMAAVREAIQEVSSWISLPSPGCPFRMTGNIVLVLGDAVRAYNLTQKRLEALYAQERGEAVATAAVGDAPAAIAASDVASSNAASES